MHELSIAMGIVDAALDEARQRGVQVSAVHLRLGALSGVVKDALLFCYEVACQDTPLAGSRLIVEDVPVVVFCSAVQRYASAGFGTVVLVSRMQYADHGYTARQGTRSFRVGG